MVKPMPTLLCASIVLLVAIVGQTHAIWWQLGLRTELMTSSFRMPEHNLADFCASALPGLSAGQLKLCQLYADHMSAVSKGARIGMVECQWQFRYQQWNCSIVNNQTVFGSSITEMASRESAFVRAITAAGVLQAIGRSCRNGDLSTCGCSTSKRPDNLNKDWVWGGCGDNVEYGYRFTKSFVDIVEKSVSDDRQSLALPSSSGGVRRRHSSLGNQRRQISLNTMMMSQSQPINNQQPSYDDSESTADDEAENNNDNNNNNLLTMRSNSRQLALNSEARRAKARRLMNLHNNEAGRRAVYRLVKIECKCHGVSGSCSMKTCWLKLPSFREVGDYLKEKYDAAIEVRYESRQNQLRARHKRYSKPTKEDLVYIEDSPNYCAANSRYGLLGTRGRQCNKNSHGPDGCRIMCCGRGYYIQKSIKEEKCKCKFQWCCSVKCETCITQVETYICK